MKKSFSRIAVIFLMLIGMFFAVTACGSVKEISIESGNMPQVMFVQGSELDLSKGKLTVDGKTIPLDSKDVDVTGYEKDTLGSQTLTISYKGKQTTLVVKVVPRVEAAEKYTYFVGEPIDAVQLRLKFTEDEGTQFTAALGDDGLIVENFDSAQEKESLTLTAKYQKDGKNYSGTFDVSVVEPQVTFKKPRKTEYGSHETQIDWLGASVTLKSPDGKTSRNIDVNSLEISGFDPNKATEEEPSVSENVTISYFGQKVGEFSVTVTYSDVSRIRKIAADLKTIDWSHYEFPENGKLYCPAGVTDAQGESAMRALNMYYGLSDADAKLITQNEIDSIARLAAVFGYNQWNEAVGRAFENVFSVDLSSGMLTLSYDCTELTDARNGYNKLIAAAADRDEDTALVFDYSALLTDGKLKAKCEDTVVYLGATVDGVEVDLAVGDLVTLIYDNATLTKIANVLGRLLTLHETLETVPASWTADSLNNYKDSIEAAYVKLVAMSGDSVLDDSAFGALDGWRSNKDFFEILYRYYYSVYKTADGTAAEEASEKLDNLIDMRLPAQLEEMGSSFAYAYIVQMTMQGIANSLDYMGSNDVPDLVESSWFMFFYRQALDGVDELVASDDEMYLELYKRSLAPILELLQTGDYGYYALNGASSFDGAYKEIWEKYLYLFEQFENDPNYVDGSEFGPLVEEMFKAFVTLRPNQQYNFIKALNYLYFFDIPQIALFFDENGLLYSDFATFIYSHYLTVLGVNWDQPEENKSYDVFTDLLLAIESYAGSDVDTFCTIMSSLQPKYEEWSGDDKDDFVSRLGFVYDKCMSYYRMYRPVTGEDGEVSSYEFDSVELGEYKDLFDRLSAEITRAYTAQVFLDYSDLIGQDIPLYLPFFASYEKAYRLSESILSCGDENIIKAYNYQPYGSETSTSSLYRDVYDIQGYSRRYLAVLGIDADEYENATAFRAFLADAADYLWSSGERLYPAYITNSGNEFVFEKENVNALMAKFRGLSADEQEFFLALDAMNLYYGGLEAYFEELLSTRPNAAQLAVSMLNLEIGYLSYRLYPDASITVEETTMTTLEFVLALWDGMEESYGALPAADKKIFDENLSEVYEYYREICGNLKTQA